MLPPERFKNIAEYAAKDAHVAVTFAPGWDDYRAQSRQGLDVRGIMLHHTAGRNSLKWLMAPRDSNGHTYPGVGGLPVRGIQYLVNRDGSLVLVYGGACYHAGLGHRTVLGDKTVVPANQGNSHFVGIEIESLGTSLKGEALGNGYTEAQRATVTFLAARWCAFLGVPETNVINQRTYTGPRKIDTLLSDTYWQKRISAVLCGWKK